MSLGKARSLLFTGWNAKSLASARGVRVRFWELPKAMQQQSGRFYLQDGTDLIP